MNKTTETTLKRWLAQAVGMSETIEESANKDKRIEAAARLRHMPKL